MLPANVLKLASRNRFKPFLERVVTAADQLTDFCFRHQGRALGYFIEELPKRRNSSLLGELPEAPNLGLGLGTMFGA